MTNNLKQGKLRICNAVLPGARAGGAARERARGQEGEEGRAAEPRELRRGAHPDPRRRGEVRDDAGGRGRREAPCAGPRRVASCSHSKIVCILKRHPRRFGLCRCQLNDPRLTQLAPLHAQILIQISSTYPVLKSLFVLHAI